MQVVDNNGNVFGGGLQVNGPDGKPKTSSGGGSPSGPAGGDLSGSYPNPGVVWGNGLPTYDLQYYPLSLNPAGYLNSISGSMVTSALGYIPYDASNPAGYIDSSALTPYLTSATAAATYQPLLTLTTTGSSGPATLTGSTLNIPQYGGGLTVGTTAIASGTVGRILFQGTGNVLQQSSQLAWDNTNNALTITTGKIFSAYQSSQPNDALKITASNAGAVLGIQNSSASGFSGIEYLSNTGVPRVFTGFNNNNGQEFRFNNFATNGYIDFLISSTSAFRVFTSRNIGISQTTDAGYKLDVNGTGAFRNTLSFLPPLASTAQTAINIYRGASTSAIALSIGITSADDAIFNTANADYIFNRSNVERFRIGVSSITSNYLINPKVTIPSGTTINYGLNVSNAAGAERIRLGIDVSENAVISLGNTSLRIRQTTSNFDFLFIDSTSGNVVIEKNTSTLVSIASAKLALNSTTSGFLPPRMTNAQMLAIATPAAGLVVYDTTNNKHCGYDGTTWQNFY